MSIRCVLLLTILLHLAFTGCRVTLSPLALHLGATHLTAGMLIFRIAAIPLLISVGWGHDQLRYDILWPQKTNGAPKRPVSILSKQQIISGVY